MANELSLFKSGSVIPDYLRDSTDDLTKHLIGNTSKAISIRGGVWRMIVGGKEVSKNEDRAMNFVVVNMAQTSRSYYAGTFVEGENAAPTCYSPDTKRPDPSVKNPQSATCALCPKNIKGSGPNNTMACRFNLRLAVVLEGDLSGNVYRLQIPGKSIFADPGGFQSYARQLAGHEIPVSSVVTEARFDTSEAVPVLKFRADRALTPAEIAISRQQRESDEAKAAIDTKYVLKDDDGKKALPAPSEYQEPATEPEPTIKKESKKAAPAAAVPKNVDEIMNNWTDDDED